MTELVPKASDSCRVLIVDDEAALCLMLREALKDRYIVDTAGGVAEAFACIDSGDYDVVVSDLKLLDGSGIEILKRAKDRDKFTEVVIITGYGTFETASEAINLGVTAYLTKPLVLTDFARQVDRAVAARLFHLKGIQLIRHSEDSGAHAVKEHLLDITSLYYFASKLMLSLDISEVMRMVLEEANDQFDAVCAVIGVHYLSFDDVFAMPAYGELSAAQVFSALESSWNETFLVFDRSSLAKGEIPLSVFAGKTARGTVPTVPPAFPVCLPMTVLGETIGFIALATDDNNALTWERQRFFYVFTTLVSAAVQHAYIDMQAKLQAKTDSLTGIANHRMFQETLHREMARSCRHKRPFCLAIIDIDDFKKINDSYGHLVGDAVLIDMTRRLQGAIRAGDLLSRYGGEEFALIYADTELDGAEVISARLCEIVAAAAFTYAGTRIAYTISIGVALHDPLERIDRDGLIRRADDALYVAKRAGKNRAVVHRAADAGSGAL